MTSNRELCMNAISEDFKSLGFECIRNLDSWGNLGKVLLRETERFTLSGFSIDKFKSIQ